MSAAAAAAAGLGAASLRAAAAATAAVGAFGEGGAISQCYGLPTLACNGFGTCGEAGCTCSAGFVDNNCTVRPTPTSPIPPYPYP